MQHGNPNDILFDALRQWTSINYPGLAARRISIDFVNEPDPVSLPVPRCSCAPVSVSVLERKSEIMPAFVPSPFQKGILAALNGKALRTDALADKVGSRSRLFSKNGVKELEDRGLIAHHERLGFYSTEFPPAELRDEEQSPKRRGKIGYIYFIQSETGGSVKIGFATDPDKRLGGLQVGRTDTLRILGVIRSRRSKEGELHEQFAAHRVRGEWFKPAPEIIAYIREHTESWKPKT